MTNLSRRRLFGLLGGAAATYFLPPIGGWKSDVIDNPSTIPGEVFFSLPNTPGKLYWTFKPKTYSDWVSIEDMREIVVYGGIMKSEDANARLTFKT